MDFLLQHIHRYVALCHGLCRFLFGLWQGFLVHLLVLVQRNGIYLHRDGRYHIRGLLVEDEVVQRIDVNSFI